MKVAIIGLGKTGKHLLDIIPPDNRVGPFDSKNPVTAAKLAEAQIGIVFVPAEVFLKIMPVLMESKIPLVVGTTGLDWPKDLAAKLKAQKISWLHATNFSLGVQLVRQLLKTVNHFKKTLPEFTAQLVETHHTQKLDAPSGTAKSMAGWCDFPVQIESLRMGDVVGLHELKIKMPQETVLISHDAHHRRLFAEGALQVARSWVNSPLGPGLFSIEEFMDHQLGVMR